MALFDALGELVGAAVLTAAPLCDLDVPDSAAARYPDLPAWLHGHNASTEVVEIVEALARELWSSAETNRLSQQDLEHHARGVAALVIAHRPTRMHLVEALERARTGPTGEPGTGEPMARRICVDVYARAKATGSIATAGLRDDLTLLLVDRVYAHLLDEPRALYALGAVLSDFIAAQLAGQSARASSTPPPETGAASLIALGLSPALAERLGSAEATARIAELRQQWGLGEKALNRLLEQLEAQKVRPEIALDELARQAAWLGEVRAQLTKPSNEEADIRRLKAKAAAALGEGDFDTAFDALKAVRRELREARRRMEERLQEEVAGLKARMTEEARATARLAELSLAIEDWAGAAELFSEAALACPSSDRESIWRFNLRRAEALARRTEIVADAKALAVAVDAFNQTIRLVADGSDQQALGLANLGLGDMLLRLGEQETGVARLQDAATAYRKAITCLPRTDERARAGAHLRFGRALWLIGERQKSRAPLREAAAAYREAAGTIDVTRYATDAITAQIGLGNTLLALEELEGAPALLEEAVAAFTAARDGLKTGGDRELLAQCQMSLGLALLGLGEQQRASDRLEAAVAAFRAALDVYTREAHLQKWALTHMNLGNALAAIGDRDAAGGAARLEDAVAAYNTALGGFPKDAEPLKWAITQMNLGTALIRLGERRDKRRNWLAAAGALVPALEIFEMHGADAYADVTRRNLRQFHESWEQLLADPNTDKSRPRPKVSRAG